jgi:large subunit ribosomal protein L31e
MSQDVERVYTVNLGKVLLSPDNQRAKRAVNMIKEFARHHMKTQQVKIEEDVSHLLWSRGIKHPPRKIRVRMTKTDEGYVLVSKYEAEEGSGGSEPTVEPDAKPTSEPVAESEPTVEPDAKPTSEPVAKSEPTVEPVAKSEPDVKSTAEPEPVAKPDKVSEKPKSKSKD